MKSRFFRPLTLVVLTLTLAACGSMRPHGPSASSRLEARSGSSLAGNVRLMQHGEHLMVMADVTGLKPGQSHGFHIHEKGDCSAVDGMSAAGHFNPAAKPHGPADADHHGGDMPALLADANGKAMARFHLTGITLDDGPTGVVGRSIIVHKDPDDYKTQPTGNSGARLACGIIVKD